MIVRLACTVLAGAVLLGGQPTDIRDWKPPAGEIPLRPQKACAALRSLTGYQFSILTATVQPASGETPAFCRVVGQVLPEVRFEVALPDSWNGRLIMFGNGGYAGERLDDPFLRNDAVAAGFVFTRTNTGHDAGQEPLGSFAVDSQKLLDYAFRSVHVTAETAKGIAAVYYGSPHLKAYFAGCSTGGRQALISAQRFPEDFDGISAGAPALDFTGTMVKFVQRSQALARAPIAASKLKLLSNRIYSLCDEKDGLKDGLIDDPRRCGFDPGVHLPRCAGSDAPDCFTDAQIRTLQAIYSPVEIPGARRFPEWPVGAEAAGRPAPAERYGAGPPRGWENWIVRDGAPTMSVLFAETFFRYLASAKKNPNLTLADVQLERDAPGLGFIESILDATDPDLSAFQQRGGKILMYFGWADMSLNPMTGVNYYEAVRQKMGASTGQFFRLYMMPGVFHCGGGPGPDTFPRLTAVIDWVERGIAPTRLVASGREDGKVTRTRPLCPYPQVARYKGSGSIDEAGNFDCVVPPDMSGGAR